MRKRRARSESTHTRSLFACEMTDPSALEWGVALLRGRVCGQSWSSAFPVPVCAPPSESLYAFQACPTQSTSSSSTRHTCTRTPLENSQRGLHSCQVAPHFVNPSPMRTLTFVCTRCVLPCVALPTLPTPTPSTLRRSTFRPPSPRGPAKTTLVCPRTRSRGDHPP